VIISSGRLRWLALLHELLLRAELPIEEVEWNTPEAKKRRERGL
jgi:hypothetical protein